MSSELHEYNYHGDVNLEHGGTFFDLSGWKDGYVSAVRVEDLDSACGATGMVLIEHVVISLTRRSEWGPPDNRRVDDHWKNALSHTGLSARELLSYSDYCRKMAIADALLSYGRYDPDDSWDNYRTHHQTIVQCEPDGEMAHDGWTADYRLDEDETIEDYVLKNHINDTGFVADNQETKNNGEN